MATIIEKIKIFKKKKREGRDEKQTYFSSVLHKKTSKMFLFKVNELNLELNFFKRENMILCFMENHLF